MLRTYSTLMKGEEHLFWVVTKSLNLFVARLMYRLYIVTCVRNVVFFKIFLICYYFIVVLPVRAATD